MVRWERLSTGIDAGAAGVGLAGRGVAGCFAGLIGAGDGFNGSADGLSGVAGVAGATVGVFVARGTVTGFGWSCSVASSGAWRVPVWRTLRWSRVRWYWEPAGVLMRYDHSAVRRMTFAGNQRRL